MLNELFQGIFDTDYTAVITVTDFLLCLATSLGLGLLMALCYMHRTRYTKSFVISLALLPAVVCVVIMMVNGNVGTGVAVAGAFSLVRFRSAAGILQGLAAASGEHQQRQQQSRKAKELQAHGKLLSYNSVTELSCRDREISRLPLRQRRASSNSFSRRGSFRSI